MAWTMILGRTRIFWPVKPSLSSCIRFFSKVAKIRILSIKKYFYSFPSTSCPSIFVNVMDTKTNLFFTYFICIVSAMGGLLFGYDWVVIGGAKIFYEQYFGIAGSPSLQGLAMSIALAGCLIGAVTAGSLADRLGRRPMLLLSALIFMATAECTGASANFEGFLVARFFGDIAIGIASGLSPMYIAEVSPGRIRGRLVSLNQLAIVVGILAAQIVHWRLAGDDMQWNIEHAWRWMFWAAAFPAALFFILALFIPESPRYLAMKGRRDKAIETLTRIGGAQFAGSEMLAYDGSAARSSEGGGLRLLFSRPYRKILIIGVVVAVFQQWCGTNVIFNYAQEVFQSAGYDVDNTFINIVVTGIANLVFTFVAIFTVDKLGRKALMLIGAGGLAGIYLILGTCYFFKVTGVFMVVLVVVSLGTPNRFAAYGSFGCMLMIVMQSLLNCAVVSRVVPSTGIPLPFFSYGGSSIIITMCMVGFILNASHCDAPEDYKTESFDDVVVEK